MKLIDKAAVLAEIEKIREHVKRLRYAVDANCIVTVRNACECLESSIDLLINSIDTLGIKRVDLEKEIENAINEYYNECEKKLQEMNDNDTDMSFLQLDEFAKHFFELGLKTQKGE